jgi:hypothetical protein
MAGSTAAHRPVHVEAGTRTSPRLRTLRCTGTPHTPRPPSPRRRTLCSCCREFIRPGKAGCTALAPRHQPLRANEFAATNTRIPPSRNGGVHGGSPSRARGGRHAYHAPGADAQVPGPPHTPRPPSPRRRRAGGLLMFQPRFQFNRPGRSVRPTSLRTRPVHGSPHTPRPPSPRRRRAGGLCVVVAANSFAPARRVARHSLLATSLCRSAPATPTAQRLFVATGASD